ncbi:class I SAM-dependent methyltransferase [Methanobacterium sp.]|uniref:class I SAM-dependent methyltransferase n=1 Tax=Methanobacterium sp. TaxID=2164 RepID=UPI0025FC6E51|nr:class I SAM-dependent methyltransferase [Methanobacterium sp.]MBI5459243.1 class I SAM-dependent methyltransferase [Methanobacterium sp.]
MNVKSFYNEREVEGSSGYLRKKVLKIISTHQIKADKYLDIGNGNGDFTLMIGNEIHSNEIFGIDISNEAVRLAKEKGINSFAMNINSQQLPFPNDYLDLITAMDIIEHLTNSDNLLNEVFRVLKPGGVFLVSSPNIGSWLAIISLLFGYLPPAYEISLEHRIGKPFGEKVKIPLAEKPIGHIKPYNLRSLKEHLEIVGFNIQDIQSTKLINDKGVLRSLSLLDGFFSKIKIYASGIIILAKKE